MYSLMLPGRAFFGIMIYPKDSPTDTPNGLFGEVAFGTRFGILTVFCVTPHSQAALAKMSLLKFRCPAIPYRDATGRAPRFRRIAVLYVSVQ